MVTLAAAPAQRLHGRVLHDLGLRIATGELLPGARIVPEDEAAAQGVSRAVVREALRALQSLGMVSALPKVGTEVRPPADWNLLDPLVVGWRLQGPDRAVQLRDLMLLRAAVEPVAARGASRAATPEQRARLLALTDAMARAAAADDLAGFMEADVEFHLLVLESSDSQVFRQLSAVAVQALTARESQRLMPAHIDDDAVAAHRAVAQAVADGDEGAAETLLRRVVDVATAEVERGGGPGA